MELSIVIGLLGVIAAAQILAVEKVNKLNRQINQAINEKEGTRDGI